MICSLCGSSILAYCTILSVLLLFCIKKYIDRLLSRNFSENYDKFFKFERFSYFRNIFKLDH